MTVAGVGAAEAGSAGESRYAEVNGIRLHCVSAGTGPLMLFVHGFPDFWLGWKEALAEFSRDHQAVAVDLRGYNRSDKPAGREAYRAVHLVEDLRQLIGALGHERAIVVAHDWGGAVAWNLAAQHPEVVDRLVIINSPHPVLFARELAHDPEQQAASEYMLLFRMDKAERVLSENGFARLKRHLQDWCDSANPPDPRTLAAYVRAWSVPGALTAMLNYYRASPLRPPSGDDPGTRTLKLDPDAFVVRRPTLVIWGERDIALRPGLLRGLERFVPDLRIVRIAEGSHWVAHECPGPVHAAIRAFVR